MTDRHYVANDYPTMIVIDQIIAQRCYKIGRESNRTYSAGTRQEAVPRGGEEETNGYHEGFIT